jgi:hypothetical protein
MAAIEAAQEQGQGARKAKALGAFYTDEKVASFLVAWAVRSADDTVLDPSFGGGVFLRSACTRVAGLGGRPERQVFGVEVDPGVHAQVAGEIAETWGLGNGHLILSDFFRTDNGSFGPLSAVIGNPPFIRYHRFSGETRRLALRRAARQGVHLSELTSSWAPFVVHSASMLKPGGRLAMVLPMEIAYATYARPVLQHLARVFAEVTLLTFREKLFRDLSEDTLLLLADGKDQGPARFLWRDLDGPETLALAGRSGHSKLAGLRRIDGTAICNGTERLVEQFIPRNARGLYQHLKRLDMIARLGDVADVGIGYVTGANGFFHLADQDARRWGIPDEFLRPAVCKGRSLTGIRFTRGDWHDALRRGEAAFLLLVDPHRRELPAGVRHYLDHGEGLGVHNAFKCRTRSPWFSVPHVYQPDALLTYMSGSSPRLVSNDAGVVAPNNLHVLRIHPQLSLSSHALAALWQTSLTRLSVEIEGHALGGGMLKLEPTEAGNSLIVTSSAGNGKLESLARELDTLLREGRARVAQSIADRALLIAGLGITEKDCMILRKAADYLRARRYARARTAAVPETRRE